MMQILGGAPIFSQFAEGLPRFCKSSEGGTEISPLKIKKPLPPVMYSERFIKGVYGSMQPVLTWLMEGIVGIRTAVFLQTFT